MRIFLFLAGVLLGMDARAQETVREVPAQPGFWLEKEGSLTASSKGLQDCWRWYERSGEPKRLVHFNHQGEGSFICLRGKQRPTLQVVNGELFATCGERTYRFCPQVECRKVMGTIVLPVTRQYFGPCGPMYCTLPEIVPTEETRRTISTQWVEQVREVFSEDLPSLNPPPAPPEPRPDPAFTQDGA